LRVLQAVLEGCPGIFLGIRAVHGLQVKVIEIKFLKLLRFEASLWIDQLEFIATECDKFRTRFGTDADPVQSHWEG